MKSHVPFFHSHHCPISHAFSHIFCSNIMSQGGITMFPAPGPGPNSSPPNSGPSHSISSSCIHGASIHICLCNVSCNGSVWLVPVSVIVNVMSISCDVRLYLQKSIVRNAWPFIRLAEPVMFCSTTSGGPHGTNTMPSDFVMFTVPLRSVPSKFLAWTQNVSS